MASQEPVTTAGGRRRSTVGMVLGLVGLVAHCTVVAYLYLVSGLVAPWYGLVVLWMIWIALLLLAIHWLRGPKPALAIVVPGLAVCAWIGVLMVGGMLLHWTA